MSEHVVHKFVRLSDTAVFCDRCGEIKVAAEPTCTRPHYPPGWIYWREPYYPPTLPLPGFYWSATTSDDISSYTVTNTAGGSDS